MARYVIGLTDQWTEPFAKRMGHRASSLAETIWMAADAKPSAIALPSVGIVDGRRMVASCASGASCQESNKFPEDTACPILQVFPTNSCNFCGPSCVATYDINSFDTAASEPPPSRVAVS